MFALHLYVGSSCKSEIIEPYLELIETQFEAKDSTPPQAGRSELSFMENEKKNGGIGFLKEIKKITMARCPFHFEVKKHMPCLFIFTVKVGKGTLSICNHCKNFHF